MVEANESGDIVIFVGPFTEELDFSLVEVSIVVDDQDSGNREILSLQVIVLDSSYIFDVEEE